MLATWKLRVQEFTASYPVCNSYGRKDRKFAEATLLSRSTASGDKKSVRYQSVQEEPVAAVWHLITPGVLGTFGVVK